MYLQEQRFPQYHTTRKSFVLQIMSNRASFYSTMNGLLGECSPMIDCTLEVEGMILY